MSRTALPAGIEVIPALRRSTPDPESTGCRAELTIAAGDLPAAARRLHGSGWFLEDIAGVDVAEGILLAAPGYERAITLDLGSHPEHRLIVARILPILRAAGADVQVEGA